MTGLDSDIELLFKYSRLAITLSLQVQFTTILNSVITPL